MLEIHPTTRRCAASRTGTQVSLTSRVGATTLQAKITDRMPPGVVYTTFHHPVTGANVITTENSDWATNCPEYKVTAVQVTASNHQSEWQEEWEVRESENKRIGRQDAGAGRVTHALLLPSPWRGGAGGRGTQSAEYQRFIALLPRQRMRSDWPLMRNPSAKLVTPPLTPPRRGEGKRAAAR